MPILRDIYYAVKGKVRRVIKLMIRGFCCVISMRQKSFLSQKTGRKARPVLGIKKRDIRLSRHRISLFGKYLQFHLRDLLCCIQLISVLNIWFRLFSRLSNYFSFDKSIITKFR